MQSVIVSWAKDNEFKQMTQNAVDSAKNSGIRTVFVVEQKYGVEYDNAITILNTDVEFNYNRALNKGISCCSDEYIVLCNNDVIFYEGFSKAENIMKEHGIHSASPCSPGEAFTGVSKEGYRIKHELRGWCIIVDRYTLDRIGKLDETYTFHYSDNAYADQLKEKEIKHHLLNGIFLQHLTSKTLRTIPKEQKYELTKRNKYKYVGYTPSKKTVSRGRRLHIPSRKTR